jgi:NodT family efflux transporter outer membrane factor (OMF) lipoprotein
MRRNVILAAATALALLPGCVKPPARTTPEIAFEVPAEFTAGRGETSEPIAAWWSELGDPVLPGLIEQALAHNHDLVAAAARVERAAAEARIAGADLKPAVGVGLSASRQRQNFIGFPDFGAGALPEVLSTTFERYGVSVDTSWEADLWGRLRAGARASLAQWQAADAELRGARLSLAAQTARAWFAAQEAQQQILLAEESAASFLEVAGQVRARYEQGLRPPLDLRLAESNLSAAEALVARRRAQLDGALRQLQVLLGEYPDAHLFEEYPASGLSELPPAVPVGLPATLVGRRPDVEAAERRVASAEQQWLAARRALYPRLTLTAGGGTATETLQDLLDGDFRVWSWVAGLTQPLFQGGRLRAGVDRAAAGGDEALAAFAGTLLRAYSEVETALAAETFLTRERLALESTAAHLTAAQRLAEDRYREGLGNYIVVLESQTRALNARSELLTARRRLLDNRVALHLALGGGFHDSTTPTEASR